MAPTLEIISRLPRRKRGKPNLLFIHGAYVGAWIWDEHFLKHFADLGWPAHAVSLRGHGASEQGPGLHAAGLRDYVEDIAAAEGQIGEDCVLIGHSMGGMVVQKLMERRTPRAAALMCSVPPSGLAPWALRLSAFDTSLFQQLSLIQGVGAWAADPTALRAGMVSDDTPEEALDPSFSGFQQESQRAILDMTWLDLPVVSRWRPVNAFVLGSENDRLFPPTTAHETAGALGVEATIITGPGHSVMIDAHWKVAADALAAWLETV